MAEYLAPGVYVEETSFRSKSIEGVSTSTTGFAGPTRKGPIGGTLEVLTSFGDFQRIYGGLEALSFSIDGVNHMAHAVKSFFDNGGGRLYVSRVFAATSTDPAAGQAKSGNPWARLIASCRMASRVISRITDSVNERAFCEVRARSMAAHDTGCGRHAAAPVEWFGPPRDYRPGSSVVTEDSTTSVGVACTAGTVPRRPAW